MQEVATTINRISNDDQVFSVIFQKATAEGQLTEAAIIPTKPRTCGRQQHRLNAGAEDCSIEDYYRINMFIPFVDRVQMQLATRFPPETKDAFYASYFTKSGLPQITEDILSKLLCHYSADIPALHTFRQDVNRLKDKIDLSDDLLEVLIQLEKGGTYENICCILRVFLTTPVGSCSCERSFSSLRRLKTYLRSTCGQSRLNGLALLNIHNKLPYLSTHKSEFIANIISAFDPANVKQLSIA